MKEFLDCGQIVNTHGIRGEVRMVPWADSPDFLCGFSTLYVDGTAKKVQASRVHKGSVIAKLDGVETVEGAMALKGKTVQIRRSDAKLPEGAFFLADIIGLDVVDGDGQKIGVLKEVLSPSVQQVYVVRGEREIMIPAVPEFILETNIEGGYIKVRLIEGM
jgi:16S rRNA processing protein RimM